MRKNVLMIVLVLLLVFGVEAGAKEFSSEDISKAIQAVIPTEFGYVDNTEYLMKHKFSLLPGISDSHIVVSADSTNFSEFGVFRVEDTDAAKQCAKLLSKYLNERKAQFQSGVVYNVSEYPKFENAKVTVIKPFVIYTILNTSQSNAALKSIKSILE